MEWLEKYRKIFIAAAFVLIVLAFGYLLYAMFFKTVEPVPAPGGQISTTTGGGLPVAGGGGGQITPGGQGAGGLPVEIGAGGGQASPIAQGGATVITALTQNAGLGAVLSSDGSGIQYYNQQDGKFYRLATDGQAKLLSDKVFYNVQKITWAPDKNRAILEYPDQAKIVYDFKNNKQVSLPNHWKDFAFSPDGAKLVMKSMADDPENRWLAVVSADGTNAQRLASLGDKDETVYPAWSPNNQTVAMYTESQSFDQQNVYFVGLNNENFKSLTVEGRGFDPKWAPAGDRLLYSVYSSASDLKPELWITYAQGENIGAGRTKLNLQTWADKCVFADAVNLYCAVPENLEEGSGLFPDLAKSSPDDLYKIDTQTGLKKLMAVPNGQYSMSDLQVSDNGYYLYFTDANTGIINKIKLK